MEQTLTLEAHIQAFILETYLTPDAADDLHETTELVEQGIIDSIRVLSLVEFMEDTYDILIEPEDLFRLTTIQHIAQVIREKGGA